jgi:toxin ParE1/3/4
MRHRYEAEAERELEQGAEISQYPMKFLRDIENAIGLILSQPKIGQAAGLRGRVREYFLRRLPYSIVYRIDEGFITIVAVAHAKRRRGYWKDRLS